MLRTARLDALVVALLGLTFLVATPGAAACVAVSDAGFAYRRW